MDRSCPGKKWQQRDKVVEGADNALIVDQVTQHPNPK
jgi:hypothetical protein